MRRRPVMEIAGVPHELIRWTARRSDQIAACIEDLEHEYVTAVDDDGELKFLPVVSERARAKLNQMAARKTRPPKRKTRPLAQLRKEWKESAIRTSKVAVDIINSLLEYARAYPQVRVVALAECGTHAITTAALGPCTTSEPVLARELFGHLGEDDLMLADRGFTGLELWRAASAGGADLLWRIRSHQVLPVREELPDGSYLSERHCQLDAQSKLTVPTGARSAAIIPASVCQSSPASVARKAARSGSIASAARARLSVISSCLRLSVSSRAPGISEGAAWEMPPEPWTRTRSSAGRWVRRRVPTAPPSSAVRAAVASGRSTQLRARPNGRRRLHRRATGGGSRSDTGCGTSWTGCSGRPTSPQGSRTR